MSDEPTRWCPAGHELRPAVEGANRVTCECGRVALLVPAAQDAYRALAESLGNVAAPKADPDVPSPAPAPAAADAPAAGTFAPAAERADTPPNRNQMAEAPAPAGDELVPWSEGERSAAPQLPPEPDEPDDPPAPAAAAAPDPPPVAPTPRDLLDYIGGPRP